jgi:hypothetical protein
MLNKALFILLFIGIFGSAFTARTTKHKTKHELKNSIQDDYTVDRVVKLLKDIKFTEQHDLEELIKNWAETEPVLQAAITSSSDALQQKIASCEEIEDILNSNIEERDRYFALIEEARGRIEHNLRIIQEQEDFRCQANKVYIGKIRENNQALKFLHYLKDKLSNPSFKDYLTNNPQLLQLRNSHSDHNGNHTLGLIAKLHLMSAIQLKGHKKAHQYQGETKEDLEATYNVDLRNEEEIGSGHIDNDKGELTREKYEQISRDVDLFISELIALIDELIAQTEESIRSLEEAEGQANFDLAEFIEQLNLENRVLNKYIDQWSEYVDDLDEIILNNQNAHTECFNQIPTYRDSYQAAQDNYDAEKSKFETSKTSQENTISMLDTVIHLYETKVAKAASTYKERVEDYVEDDQKVFDKTDFEKRKSSEDIDQYGN